MATVEEILLKFKGVDDGVTATQHKVKSGMDDIDSSTKNADKSTKSLHGNIKNLSGAMTGLGGAIAGAGILMFYQQALQMSAGSEQTWGRFTVALGRTGMEIKSTRTEYGGLVDQVQNDTGRLKGDITTIFADLTRVGVTSKDTLKDSTESITALSYLTQEDVGTIEQGFTKLIGKSQIQERALMSIGIRGNIFTEVLKKNGLAMEDWANLTENQRANLLNQAVAMQNGAEANKEYKESYEGLMNQITQVYKTFMTEVGNALLPVVKDIVTQALPVLKDLLTWFKDLPMGVKEFLILLPLIVAGLVAIGGTLMMLQPVVGVLGAMGEKLGILKGKSKDAKDGLGDLADSDCPDPCGDGSGVDVDGSGKKKDGTSGGKKKKKTKTTGKGGIGVVDLAELGSMAGGGWGAIDTAGVAGEAGASAGGLGIGSLGIAGAIGGLLAGAGIGMMSQGDKIADFIGGGLRPVTGMSEAQHKQGVANVKSQVADPMNAQIGGLFGNPTKWFGDTFTIMKNDVNNALKPIPGMIFRPFQDGYNYVRGATTNTSNFIVGGFWGIVGGITGALNSGKASVIGIWNTITGTFWGAVTSVDQSMASMVDKIKNWTGQGVDWLKQLYCIVMGCSPGIIPAFKKMSRDVPMHIRNTLPSIQQLSGAINAPSGNFVGANGGGTNYYYSTFKIENISKEELMAVLMEIFGIAGATNIPQGDAKQ